MRQALEISEAGEVAKLDIGLSRRWRIGAISVRRTGADLRVRHEGRRSPAGGVAMLQNSCIVALVPELRASCEQTAMLPERRLLAILGKNWLRPDASSFTWMGALRGLHHCRKIAQRCWYRRSPVRRGHLCKTGRAALKLRTCRIGAIGQTSFRVHGSAALRLGME